MSKPKRQVQKAKKLALEEQIRQAEGLLTKEEQRGPLCRAPQVHGTRKGKNNTKKKQKEKRELKEW